ncbi:MAG: aldo/keto reductase, partial [Conexibacteraceae bacterium]|nr:aldo/keto reductase [Conexibacteraceae bacterium]
DEAAGPMRRAAIGCGGPEVTALGFGGAAIGNLYAALDDETAEAVLEAAWAGGIRYFDTAPHYGLGLSERRIGNALRTRPRDEYVISTKVGRLLVPNARPTGSDLEHGGFDVPDDWTRERDYSRDGILRSVEASLGRLGLDRLDIVFVHDPEEHMGQALGEAVPALIELREQGAVGAVGAGMNLVAPLRRFVAETDIDVVLVAGRWTLIDRSAGPLLEECLHANVAVIAAGVFNSGLLAHAAPSSSATFDYGPVPDDALQVAVAAARACADHGTTLPTAALQFPLRHAAVSSVLVGMRTPAECRQDLVAVATDIDERLWSDLPEPISDRS